MIVKRLAKMIVHYDASKYGSKSKFAKLGE
jgi:hypothetical protein